MRTPRLIRNATMLFAAMLTIGMAGPAVAADKAGDVISVRGKAVIERQTERFDARVRSALQESDSVVTKERTRLKMLFRDDSVLTLGANSRLNIRKYLYDPTGKRAESVYELADGKLRSVVGSKGFKVTTPTAFAAARGTVFTVSYNPETGTTEIKVLEGSVQVQNVDAQVAGMQVVFAGQSTTVAGNAPPTPPVSFDPGGEGGEGSGPGLGEGEGGDGILNELQDQLEQEGAEPPIEQVPAQATTRMNLDIRFR